MRRDGGIDHRWNGQAIKTIDNAMKDFAEIRKV